MKSKFCSLLKPVFILVSLSVSFQAFSFIKTPVETLPYSSPNHLISFTADCKSYYAEIKWTTAFENGKGYYIIERTKDGVHFETLTMLDNKFFSNATTETKEYAFKDESPLLGVSYYRISAFDSLENKKLYINTIVYTPCENDETIDAFFDENLITVSVNVLSNDPNICNISVTNDKNRAVISQIKHISTGMNSIKLDTRLNYGVYHLNVNYRNNKYFSKSFQVGLNDN